MTEEDRTAELGWRNLAVQWHVEGGMPGCGCDDDTADTELCADSVEYADRQFACRPDPALDGPPDPWELETWRAAWGRNVPLIASAADLRLPMPPARLTWLATRLLVGGRQAIELILVPMDGSGGPLPRVRVVAEPSTVAARARQMLDDLPDAG